MRDTFGKGSVSLRGLASSVQDVLEQVQKDMLDYSRKQREELTVSVKTYGEFKEAMGLKRFIRAFWCEDAICEKKIKEETKATPRVLELERMDDRLDGTCVACGKPAKRQWLFAQR